nr:hypothetical protein Iba_chr11fCG7550 [Ipomoea batatas]
MSKICRDTYIGVELAHKAGEIIVLEIAGQQILSEFGGFPNDEGGAAVAPRYHVVGGRIVHQLEESGEEFPIPAVESVEENARA